SATGLSRGFSADRVSDRVLSSAHSRVVEERPAVIRSPGSAPRGRMGAPAALRLALFAMLALVAWRRAAGQGRAPAPPAIPPPAPPTATPVPTVPPGEPVSLSIPKINLQTEVQEAGVVKDRNGNPVWETRPYVAVHYDVTGPAGAPGNPVIAGHVVTLYEGNV